MTFIDISLLSVAWNRIPMYSIMSLYWMQKLKLYRGVITSQGNTTRWQSYWQGVGVSLMTKQLPKRDSATTICAMEIRVMQNTTSKRPSNYLKNGVQKRRLVISKARTVNSSLLRRRSVLLVLIKYHCRKITLLHLFQHAKKVHACAQHGFIASITTCHNKICELSSSTTVPTERS